MEAFLAELLGAVIITGLITFLLTRFVEKRFGKQLVIVLTTNLISAIIIVALARLGFGDFSRTPSYVMGQLIVLGLILYGRTRRQGHAL